MQKTASGLFSMLNYDVISCIKRNTMLEYKIIFRSCKAKIDKVRITLSIAMRDGMILIGSYVSGTKKSSMLTPSNYNQWI